MKRHPALARFFGRLERDQHGLALLEFAFMLPIFLLMSLTGAELTNYITVKMRISQLALHLADNAARMGTGSQLSAKQVSELDVNDLLTGAGLQAGELNLYTQGRVIISSLEVDPANAGKYRIRWQRCRGAKTAHASTFGVVGQSSGVNMAGMGSTGRLVTTQSGNATMFVEVYFDYVPLVSRGTAAPTTSLTEIASMLVRDRRDLSDDSATTNLHPNGVYKVSGVTASTC